LKKEGRQEGRKEGRKEGRLDQLSEHSQKQPCYNSAPQLITNPRTDASRSFLSDTTYNITMSGN